MSNIGTINGFRTGTFPRPPNGWASAEASDTERNQFGFPERDALGERTEQIAQKMSSYVMIEPVFQPRTKGRAALPGFNTDHGLETLPTWSGGVALASGGKSFSWVEGSWTMPGATVPNGADPAGSYVASAWVGIDGDDDSNDVLQAGCDVSIAGGGGIQIAPWWEWYPGETQWISNFAVSPGDTLNVVIRMLSGSTSSASIFFANDTTNIGMTFTVSAPDGISIQGNCSEWIVEKLTSGTLANFGTVIFNGCFTGNYSSPPATLDTANAINMIDNGNIIAESQITEQKTIIVKYI